MPSKKTRIAIVAEDELLAALDDLAESSGKTRAGVAAELLREMIPQLHDMAKLVRLAKANNKAGAKRQLQHMYGNAMAELMAEQLPLPVKGARK